MNKVILSYNPSSKMIIEARNEIDELSCIFECTDNTIEVSDGYHTMTELYQHRIALFCALCKVYDGYITSLQSRVTCYKSKLHHDGTMFDDSFIVQMIVKQLDGKIEQISYHIPIEYWDKFKLMTLEHGFEWDGHSSNDVIERLMRL